MEQEIHYLISDAAKRVEVESHVLRYWEEELQIPIKRNELGHRFYTEEDVKRFKNIKNLKEQGLQLKAIRVILKDGKIEKFGGEGNKREEEEYIMNDHIISEQEKHMIEIIATKQLAEVQEESKEQKSMRLQMLLRHMIAEAVKECNKELCEDIKESVLKEMDYQFRLQEEREEERENQRVKREEEHYKKVDELLRTYSKKGKNKEKAKPEDKQNRFGTRKKELLV